MKSTLTLFVLFFLICPIVHSSETEPKDCPEGLSTPASHLGWARYVTNDGRDINVRLTFQDGKVRGELIVGASRVTGDQGPFIGGANNQSFSLEFDTSKIRKGRLELYSKRYCLTLGLRNGAVREGAVLRFSSLNLSLKSGFWPWSWDQVFQFRRDELRQQPTVIDRTPITGESARLVYDRIPDAPNLDVEGTLFRGLYFSPYLTQGGESYRISFDFIRVPSDLVDALNGLRSRGLSPEHPIFNRVPEPVQEESE